MGDDSVTHDPLCENYRGPCCPWMGDCDCACTCARIREIREDERRRIVRNRNNERGERE